jgi:hypothetical protein
MRVFIIAPNTHANIINKNDISEGFSENHTYTIRIMNNIFDNFPTIVDNKENSILKLACMRANNEELIS